MDKKTLDRKARYMQGKKHISADIDESLFYAYRDKAKADNLTTKDIIETLLYKYVNGDIEISRTR